VSGTGPGDPGRPGAGPRPSPGDPRRPGAGPRPAADPRRSPGTRPGISPRPGTEARTGTVQRAGLSARDEGLRELMDDPGCDPERLRATLERFDLVNRLVAGWGAVYRRRLRPFLTGLGRPARVLDIGAGGGDLVARLAGWSAADGLSVQWTGADPDPRALQVAAARDVPPNVEFIRADARTLVDAGEHFDVVLSNHVLHHLTDDELADFAETTALAATGLVLHGDIARGRLAYGLYAVGITPFAPGTFLRTDGLRSIRRSYRPDELSRALGAGWQVETPAPFRLLATSSRA
jgi:2-polyprenyl-3-methyl-5-hydroxy-6-metoxy-1,4-benzoquinol methylase